MEAPVFAKFVISSEAKDGGGEFEKAEGLPEVFAEGSRDGFFAQEGKLL